jgi:hypothetical protein
MVHAFGFKGLVRFSPEVDDSFLVGRKLDEFKKNREDIKFDILKVVAVDDAGVRTWDAKFCVPGSSLTGDSRHSAISHLLGTFAYLKTKGNVKTVRFSVQEFSPRVIKFSVDPKWAPGSTFIVGGSVDNNEEFTVRSNVGQVYNVVEWVNIEKPFRGKLWDFSYFSGEVCVIQHGLITKTAVLGEKENEPIGSLGMVLNMGKNHEAMTAWRLATPNMSIAESIVSKVSILMGGR